ncbi:MAG: hypothetical protein ACK6D2_03030 [Planctomycetota bacterium]
MPMRLATLLPFVFAAATTAQHVVAYDPLPAGTGQFVETQVFSRLVPGPLPPDPGYPIGVVLPPLAGNVPPGDATFDGRANRIWYTNGQLLASRPSPNFAFAAPAIPPFPIAPAVLAAIGGPATGIAYNPLANVMFVASAAAVVIGVTPVPGTPIVVPPFALPVLGAGLSGLDYDSVTNSLFACDVNGLVFNVAIGGAPLGPPIGPLGVPGIAGDVCIDKTTQINPFGLRPIYVCAGGLMRDVSTMLSPPQPNGAVAPTGLAFVGRAASQPGPSATCGGFAPVYETTAPMTSGNPVFGLRIRNAAPLTPVVFAVDFVFNPIGLLINGGGSLLHLVPGSPSLVTLVGFTDAVGTADLPLGLMGVAPGVGPLYTQVLWPCAADPAGFALTDMQSIHVTGH